MEVWGGVGGAGRAGSPLGGEGREGGRGGKRGGFFLPFERHPAENLSVFAVAQCENVTRWRRTKECMQPCQDSLN